MGQIQYSEKYFDGTCEYGLGFFYLSLVCSFLFFFCITLPLCSHVVFPLEVAELLAKGRLLSENEWRAIGMQQSRGLMQYANHRTELHIMLFRRPLLNYLQENRGQPTGKH